MPSLNRVIKASHTANVRNKTTITTEYEFPKEQQPTELLEETLLSVEALNEAALKEAEAKKKSLFAQAQAEIEQIKKEAYEKSFQKGYEEGKEQGVQDGYQAGFDQGHQKAVEQVELESQDIRNQAIEMMHEAHEQIHKYEIERKDEILKLATHMAEKIVHNYIDHADDGLLAIAKPYFYQIDKEEEFVTITVHPDKRKQIEDKLDEIKAISPGTRFMVLGSPTLEKRGLIIESSHSIVDLQIKKQLERMLEEIYEMERTVDA